MQQSPNTRNSAERPVPKRPEIRPRYVIESCMRKQPVGALGGIAHLDSRCGKPIP
jgi:hypothetical protein